MYRATFSFFAGTLVTTVSLYLSGGSNSFILVFGILLGLMLTLLPTVLYPKTVSTLIWSATVAGEQARKALTAKDPRSVPTTNLEKHIIPAEITMDANPYAEDCVTALRNLGMKTRSAERTVKDLIDKKQYASFEELFKDAVQVRR